MSLGRAGSRNAVAKSIDWLIAHKVDSIYWFSDFIDPIDEEQVKVYARRFRAEKIPVYLQPRHEITPSLEVLAKAWCEPSGGKLILPDGIRGTIADNGNPPPTEVVVATVEEIELQIPVLREKRDEKTQFWHGSRQVPNNEEFNQQLQVFERKNFDLVLHGPRAYAKLFLKQGDKYVGEPLTFAIEAAHHEGKTNVVRKFMQYRGNLEAEGDHLVLSLIHI